MIHVVRCVFFPYSPYTVQKSKKNETTQNSNLGFSADP